MATTETETQREDRMLHQSFLKDTEVRPLGNGRYATRSAETPAGMTYLTTERTCSCAWFAQTGTICSHVARARFEASFEPPTPVVTPAQAAAARARMAAHDPIADAARVAANRDARLARMAAARQTA